MGWISNAWNKVKKAAKKVVKAVKDTVEGAVDAVVKTVKSFIVDGFSILKHLGLAAWYAATGQTDRAKDQVKKAIDSMRRFASDAFPGVFFGVAIVIAIVLVSGVQRIFGFQNEPRPLRAKSEMAVLRDIFQTQLDYDQIRIVEGELGLLNPGTWGAREVPYTIGYTIYVPSSAISMNTLVHEAVHIWQWQKGGPRYILESVRAQRDGEEGMDGPCLSEAPGYDFDNALRTGKGWQEFNPEQQAAFIEYGQCVDHNLFLTLTGNLFVPQAGGVDYMANFVDAVNAVRAGHGAAW